MTKLAKAFAAAEESLKESYKGEHFTGHYYRWAASRQSNLTRVLEDLVTAIKHSAPAKRLVEDRNER